MLPKSDDARAVLEGLFTQAPVSFQIYAPDGRSLFVNQAFRDLFGSEPPADYCIFDDEIAKANGLDQMIRRAFDGETIRLPPFWYDPRELQHVLGSEGRRVSVELHLFPIRDAAGNVCNVAIYHKDVTVREHLALREQELEATLESIGDGCGSIASARSRMILAA